MTSKSHKSISVLFIGHLAIDSIIRFKKEYGISIGGSVTFGSLALRKYSKLADLTIISNVGKVNFDKSLLKKFEKKNINLSGLKWSDSRNTKFVLDYADHSRTLTLKSKSPNLRFSDIPEEILNSNPKIIVLGPLCNEISHKYVANILEHFPNAYIGIDLQGFIRKIDHDGIVSYIPDEDMTSNMKNIINLIGDKLILKGSEIEMKLLSGKDQFDEVMTYFQSCFSKGIFIMTLGDAGSLVIKCNENMLKIPAFKPKIVVDETGAGDVYLAIFMYELINSKMAWEDVNHSAYLASAAASFLVEKKGPNGFETMKNVVKRVNQKNYTRD